LLIAIHLSIKGETGLHNTFCFAFMYIE